MSSNPWNRPPYYAEKEANRHNVAGPIISLLILVAFVLAAVQSLPESLPAEYYQEVKERANGYVLDYRGEPQSCELACHGGR